MTPTARSALAVVAVLCAFAAVVGIATLFHGCECGERTGQPVAISYE